MANTINPHQNEVGSFGPSITMLTGRVVTSTNGTISSQDVRGGGCTVTKTGGKNGRYTITLIAANDVALTDFVFLGAGATVIGPDDAAYTTAKGLVPLIRDIDIGEGADDGTVEIQFVEPQTAAADAELMDAAAFSFYLLLGNKKLG